MTTFWRSSFLKPLASARTVYAPGVRFGALYSPASSDVRVRETPLAVSMTVTVAPATTPPLWSVTVPIMRPVLPCENAGTLSNRTPNATASTLNMFRRCPPADIFFVFAELISDPLTRFGFNSDSGPTPYPRCPDPSHTLTRELPSNKFLRPSNPYASPSARQNMPHEGAEAQDCARRPMPRISIANLSIKPVRSVRFE